MRFAVITATLSVVSFAQGEILPPSDAARGLALALRRIGAEGRLLYVTAHPDDEDNALLAYYKHGLGFDVTLLTLTRGDGGQNQIGPELFEAIGVLRAEELRAAHRFDGARQRFTRAYEFGYSFSVSETFEKWGEEPILRDVVKVIREVRPHVICTMSIATSGGGRHHQASAYAARRAFDIAAENVWPELGEPWAVSRLFESARTAPGDSETFAVPVSEFDPVLGCTYAALGFRARSMHKCQGTGQVASLTRSSRRSRWRLAVRRGRPPARDGGLFEGLEVYRDHRTGKVSPKRVDPWGAKGPPNPTDPGRCSTRLLELLRSSHESMARPILAAHSLANPIHVEAVSDRDVVRPGDRARIRVLVHNRGVKEATVDGVFLEVRERRGGAPTILDVWSGLLSPGERQVVTVPVEVAEDANAWTAVRLLREPDADRYVDALDRLHEPAFARVTALGSSGGVPLDIPSAPVVHRSTDPAFPSKREVDVALLPRTEVRLVHDVTPVVVDRPGGQGEATVALRISGPKDVPYRCVVSLRADDGSVVSTAFVQGKGDGEHAVPLTVIHDEKALATRYSVVVSEAARSGRQDRIGVSCQTIDYPHIRRVFLERQATGSIVVFPCARPVGVNVGWVTGTGDEVASCLRRAGVVIHELGADDLLRKDLGAFDVIVTGVRAYKVRDDLKAAHPRLRSWMEAGGRLIVLYNKTPEMNGGPLGRGGSPWAPYPARVGRGRVTVEEAPVSLVDPDHPFFRSPNRITEDDWSGWVQERGLYFLEARDPRYQELLTITEPWPGNRGPKKGSLVTTSVGDGSWTYVGLALFRQLPAGVPGGFRLFMNLLAASR